jgi:hypothetical protein
MTIGAAPAVALEGPDGGQERLPFGQRSPPNGPRMRSCA